MTATFDQWYANTDFDRIAIHHGDDREEKKCNPQIRRLYEESQKIDTTKFPTRDGHRIIFVTNANIGPCGHKDVNGDYCRRTVARVMYRNNEENGGRYDKSVHADDGTGHGYWNECHIIPACPKCKTEDSLTTQRQAYGDRTTCKTAGCDYTSWYDIGD